MLDKKIVLKIPTQKKIKTAIISNFYLFKKVFIFLYLFITFICYINIFSTYSIFIALDILWQHQML